MYNPMHRNVEDKLFPKPKDLNIAFYAWGPLAGGLLARTIDELLKPKPDTRFHEMPVFGDMYLKRHRRIFRSYGTHTDLILTLIYGTGENYWRGPIWININYLALAKSTRPAPRTSRTDLRPAPPERGRHGLLKLERDRVRVGAGRPRGRTRAVHAALHRHVAGNGREDGYRHRGVI